MNSTRIAVSKLTILGVIGLVVVAIAFSSTSWGQQSTSDILNKWTSFNPTIPQAVVVRTCNNSLTDKLEPVTVKVGQPYLFADYGVREKISWTGELIWNPNRAVAKRTFKFYDMAKMSSANWGFLRKNFADSSVSVAFVSPSKNGYVATPVKWTTSFAEVFGDAYVIAENAKDPKMEIVKAMASEILNLGTSGLEPLVPASIPQSFKSIDDNAKTKLVKSALMAYECGDVGAFESLVPAADIFIGFSETPKGFNVDHIGEIITLSGYWGQPLGTVMPSWPTEDD